jgi:hypothetical protein
VLIEHRESKAEKGVFGLALYAGERSVFVQGMKSLGRGGEQDVTNYWPEMLLKRF